MSKEFYKMVADIQLNLKAPKTQYNKFGEYYYRNLEDILTAVKPLLLNINFYRNFINEPRISKCKSWCSTHSC